jgi:hypothetical protein
MRKRNFYNGDELMTAKNDITNDLIKTKPASNKYFENYDRIFRKPNEKSTDTTIDSITSDHSEPREKQNNSFG